MNVSIQEILDYRKCPLSYYFKYVQKLPEDNLSTQVSEQIHEIVYYFYSKVMNKDMPTIDMLKNQWESTWFSGIDPMQYILTPRNERLETGQKAVPLISNFYNANCLAPGMPLALNQEFKVELGDNIVSGKIELVREIQRRRHTAGLLARASLSIRRSRPRLPAAASNSSRSPEAPPP
jgi:hypothetical protein